MGSLANELRRIRRIAGLSLREVESQSKISNAYLSQLERGSAKRPSADKLARLAEVYGVDPAEFLAIAGYLPKESGKSASTEQRSLSPAMKALLETDLDEEDERQLLDYAAFLRSRKQKTKSSRRK